MRTAQDTRQRSWEGAVWEGEAPAEPYADWEGEAPAEPGVPEPDCPHFCFRLRRDMRRISSQSHTINPLDARLGRSLALPFVCLCIALLGGNPRLFADERFEADPYRVLVSVSFGNESGFSIEGRREAIADLSGAIARGYGAMWDAQFVESGWLFPASRTGLERLTLNQFHAQFKTDGIDKVFLLTVDARGSRFEICGREWDAATRWLGPVVTAETFDRGDAAATAADVVRRMFQPVLSVERVDGENVVLRMQGGRRPAADQQAAQVRPGDVIRPFFRYLDEEQVVRRIQFLPWTYLLVDEVDGGRVKCTLVSGLRSPLGGSRRRSVDVMALRVEPHFDSTQLKLVPRGNPSKPLIGYTVKRVLKRQAHDEPTGESLQFVTDRQGMIDIPRLGEETESTHPPLVWLYVQSGESLLTRVPFVPGIVAAETIELPDDSIRLGVEGETDLLTIRLVDTVAKRAVLIARARILAREGDWPGVDKQLAEIEKLPPPRSFVSELTLIRVPAVEAARRDKNGAAEANVNRISTRVTNLIRRYLDDAPVRTLEADVAELRRLDAEDKRLVEEKD